MKSLTKLFVYVCLSLFLSSTIYAQDYFTISSPPSIYVGESGGALEGPIVDAINLIASNHNAKLAVRMLPWKRSLAYMESGNLDLTPVIFFTADRAKFMSFSIPYAEVRTMVFVSRGQKFPFNHLTDLIGKVGAQVRGDSISAEFEDFSKQLDVVQVADYEAVIRMLNSNRVDYAVAPEEAFYSEARRLKFSKTIESLPNPIASRPLHIAISKKSPFLKFLPELNNRLNIVKARGLIEDYVKGKRASENN